MAAQPNRGVPLSTLAPKYLHTNSTSHTWPFSAIAELIDNAYDPDVGAKQFWIDRTAFKRNICLTFMDDGNGLNFETMQKMLSFGYSDKTAVNGQEPIGMYGNGFKSGSMRLGKDAIVFSRSRNASCVGMLSQTYLEKIHAEQIIIPIICIEERKTDSFSVSKEHNASLVDILRYSPFNTQAEILAELDAISSPWSRDKTGTRIIVWNLRRTSEGLTEFDFETDRYDFRIPSEVYETLNESSGVERAASYIPETLYSLQAYCSILYLKPRMQVIVRGQKVKTMLIAKSLANIRKDFYKPTFLAKRIPIIFGFNTKRKDQYGVMMYHKNRLIKAYERVGCQLKANIMGVGVIGVIECNFLDPTHNKQSFIETDKYRKTMANLGIKLEEYWKEAQFRKKREDPNSTIPVEDTMKRPDQNWVQCDECLKWRKLPDGIDCTKLPDKWFCRMNPDPQFRSCQVEEEPEDSDDDQPSYRKTYKQQEREDKKKKERTILLDQRRLAEERRRQQQNLSSPSTPTTPRSRLLHEGAITANRSLLRSSINSQAAVSPSTSSRLPIITNVCSLSNIERKRPPVASPQTTPKRVRLEDLRCAIADSSSRSPSMPTEELDSSDTTDDEVSIVESSSTPKPVKSACDVGQVKKEEPSEASISMMLECSDDAATDVSATKVSTGASSAEAAPPAPMVSAVTQTEMPKLKQERESQEITEGSSTKTNTRQSSHSISQTPKISQLKQEEDNQSAASVPTGDTSAQNEDSLPPCFSNIDEMQRQQDELMNLLEVTGQERNDFKEQLEKVISELKELRSRIKTKHETSHQACQTEEEEDCRTLFEKAKQKVHDLVKDTAAFIPGIHNEMALSPCRDEEKDIDDISRPVGCLVQALEKGNSEREKLRGQLKHLTEEKKRLAAECEELRLKLQQQAESTSSLSRADGLPAQAEEASTSTSADQHSGPDTHMRLIELRKNAARLLLYYRPDMDFELDEVNYDCNVIDEILEQCLSCTDSQ